ncbi:MAG TPA: hypothetical protein VJ953_06740 [Saprospiraceae bacterium]|nr:hypothetical protein [Saprospiraceae bacterium]
MKDHQISEFYDALSGEYHTIYPDWDQAIKRRSKVLAFNRGG